MTRSGNYIDQFRPSRLSVPLAPNKVHTNRSLFFCYPISVHLLSDHYFLCSGSTPLSVFFLFSTYDHNYCGDFCFATQKEPHGLIGKRVVAIDRHRFFRTPPLRACEGVVDDYYAQEVRLTLENFSLPTLLHLLPYTSYFLS